MRRVRLACVVSVVALAAAGCGGDDQGGAPTDGPDATVAQVDPEDCGLEAFDAVEKPVEVTFWHQQLSTNAEALQEQVDRFNATQNEVHVTATFEPPDQILTAFRAGLETGNVPNVVQIDGTAQQALLDSRSTVPVQACVAASDFALDDFLPRALAYYTVEDVLQSMPWNVASLVLHYDRHMFRDAGLDPDDPPETLDEVRDYSRQIVDAGVARHGIALTTFALEGEALFARSDELYVNNANGRSGRATAANLESDTGRSFWKWRQEMLDSGLAIDTGRSFTADNLIAVVNAEAAMTFGWDWLLGPIINLVGEGGQYGGDLTKSGVGPMPGLAPGGGIQPAGGSLHLVTGRPEQVAAAWKFVEYLTDTEQQVALHLETGYVPVRESAVNDPRVQDLWQRMPIFRVSYDQLVTGEATDATAGAVIGDFIGVSDAVQRSWDAMQDGQLTPDEALARAQREADEAIQNYNERLGL